MLAANWWLFCPDFCVLMGSFDIQVALIYREIRKIALKSKKWYINILSSDLSHKSHNAPFLTEICPCVHWLQMVHCEILVWCIVGLVKCGSRLLAKHAEAKTKYPTFCRQRWWRLKTPFVQQHVQVNENKTSQLGINDAYPPFTGRFPPKAAVMCKADPWYGVI